MAAKTIINKRVVWITNSLPVRKEELPVRLLNIPSWRVGVRADICAVLSLESLLVAFEPDWITKSP